MSTMPRWRSLAALAAVAAAACSGGQDRHLRVTPRAIDFGRVLHGDVVARTLTLRNDGDRAVFVTGTTLNCACFSIETFHRVLQPGEERSLTIRLDTNLVPAEPLRGKRLDLLTDDPLLARVEVPLSGEIVPACTIVPPEVHLGPLEDPRSLEPQKVTLRPADGMDLRVLDWRVNPPGDFEVLLARAGKDMELTLRLRPEAAARGHVQAVLVVQIEVEGQGFARRAFARQVRILGG